jgi:hypothetical protein
VQWINSKPQRPFTVRRLLPWVHLKRRIPGRRTPPYAGKSFEKPESWCSCKARGSRARLSPHHPQPPVYVMCAVVGARRRRSINLGLRRARASGRSTEQISRANECAGRPGHARSSLSAGCEVAKVFRLGLGIRGRFRYRLVASLNRSRLCRRPKRDSRVPLAGGPIRSPAGADGRSGPPTSGRDRHASQNTCCARGQSCNSDDPDCLQCRRRPRSRLAERTPRL